MSNMCLGQINHFINLYKQLSFSYDFNNEKKKSKYYETSGTMMKFYRKNFNLQKNNTKIYNQSLKKS